MRLGLDATQTVFTLGVGDDEGAIDHHKSDAGYAQFAACTHIVLHRIAVAIDIDLAGDTAFIAEHATLNVDFEKCRVGPHRLDNGGAVDAVTLLRTHAQSDKVGQFSRGLRGYGAHVKCEFSANSTSWVGNRDAAQTCGTQDVSEAGR